MKASLPRTLVAGLIGGLAASVSLFLTFRVLGFGLDWKGILISSPLQSQKLVAVWTQIQPLPLLVQKPYIIIGGLYLFTVFHAFVYRSVAAALPHGVWARCWRMALTLWVAVDVFWEFLAPFNQLGEPFSMLTIEIAFWLFVAFCEAAAVTWIMERRQPEPSR